MSFKSQGGKHSHNRYVLIVQVIRVLILDRVLVLAHVSENDLDLWLVPKVYKVPYNVGINGRYWHWLILLQQILTRGAGASDKIYFQKTLGVPLQWYLHDDLGLPWTLSNTISQTDKMGVAFLHSHVMYVPMLDGYVGINPNHWTWVSLEFGHEFDHFLLGTCRLL